MGNLQSNPSSSTQTTEKTYEVFLNFRGIDTRDGFTNYLYEALLRKSIETFIDDIEIPTGEEIGPKLLKAIEESQISVVIFSKEYATSKWCLRELVKIMECEKKNSQTVIPVFYKVTVHDVRHQEGSFKDGFDQLEKEFEEKLENEQVDSADVEKGKKEFYDEMQDWRLASESACHLKGQLYEKGPETKVIDKIVKDIWTKLMRTCKLCPCDFKGLFGIEERLEQVMSLLCLGKHEDYVATILDNCLQSLKVLSNRSLITISNDKIIQMHDLLQEMGMEIVRKEDLNNPSNRSRLWTQEDVLDTLKNDDGTNAIRGIFLNMANMDEEHLSSEAFKKLKNLRLLKFYDSTSYQSLYHTSKPYSSNVLFPNGISYLSNKLWSLNWFGYPLKALPSNFIPRELVELKLRHSNIEKLWEGNKRAPKLKWIILQSCSYLIKVLGLVEAPRLEKIDIEFCQCLLNMEICKSLLGHRSCNHFPALKYLRLSRCYKLTQISDLLDAQLLEKIDILFCTNLRGFPSPANHFNNLRKFYMRNCDNLQSFPNCPFPSLVSLDLCGCINLARISDPLNAPLLEKVNLEYCKSLRVFPTPACHFNNLQELNLSNCKNLEIFPNNIRFSSLVSLDLHRCIKLAKISDVLDAPLLQTINLYGCKSLLDFPRPAQHFNNLCNLYLEYCKNLPSFPSDNIHFRSLKCLDFHSCIKLREFPLISGNIEKLYMRKTAIHQVPSKIENLPELVELVLADCTRLNHISSSIGKLKALRYLCLSNCSALECFPEISDTMGSLKNLDLSGTAIKGLHHSIENLSGLQILCLGQCENLDDVPSSIENLTELVKLDLGGCTSLKHLSFNI